MEACLYDRMEDNAVRCALCPHRCIIKPGKRGICHVRENRDGTLETLVYGRLIARHVDPIEKKPIFHLLPGSRSYSVATVGCNFKCRFCQNADIAQMPADRNGRITGESATPESVIADAEQHRCRSIAYTYTEPTVYFEFARDTAQIAKTRGLFNVFVTNGYMTAEAIDMIAPYLDAANVDLKAFTDEFYKTACSAKLAPVLDTLKRMKEKGVWVEVTTLVIPDLNDDPGELTDLARFIADELGPETPWHISRFHPTYKLIDRPPTPVRTLVTAAEIGRSAGLRYVYMGNVPGQGGENTLCHQCGTVVIERWGFSIAANRMKGGNCPDCGAPMDGIWQ